MPRESKLKFYQRRADEELSLAIAAIDEGVRAVHRRLVAEFRALADLELAALRRA